MGEMSSVPSSSLFTPQVPHLHAVRHEVSKKKARKKFVLWATTRVVVGVAVLAEMSHQLKKAGLGNTARAC